MDVKAAVSKAQSFLLELVPVSVSDVLLEEVEKTGLKNDTWQITFSYPPRVRTLGAALGAPGSREYKTVIMSDSGEFQSLKIRQLAE